MLRSLGDCDIFRVPVEMKEQKARLGSLDGAGPGELQDRGRDARATFYFAAGMKPTFSTTAWPAALRVNSMNLAASPEGSPLV